MAALLVLNWISFPYIFSYSFIIICSGTFLLHFFAFGVGEGGSVETDFLFFIFSHAPRLDYGFGFLTNPTMYLALSIKEPLYRNIFPLGEFFRFILLLFGIGLNRL